MAVNSVRPLSVFVKIRFCGKNFFAGRALAALADQFCIGLHGVVLLLCPQWKECGVPEDGRLQGVATPPYSRKIIMPDKWLFLYVIQVTSPL